MIKLADTNKDGKVSFEEYKAMLKKLGTVYIRTFSFEEYKAMLNKLGIVYIRTVSS